MTKRCLFPLLVLLHFLAEGQVHSVKLLNADTTVCSGSTVRLQSSFSIGSFQYIGTYGGKDYFMDTVSRSWTEARTEAVSKGMELWVIDNLAENNAVYDLIPVRTRVNTYFWIGLKQDQTTEATGEYGAGWKWVDDRTLDATFKYWFAYEPDNKFLDKTEAGFASLGLLPSGSKWSDMTDLVPSGYQAYAIAEMNSSPIRID